MAQSKKTSTAKKSSSSKPAAKKGAASSKKSSSPAKSRKAPEPVIPPSEPVRPIRREVTAVVFLFLAVFMVISHFNSDGKFIVYFSNLMKGLVGWGFWIYVPAFLVCALILGFHRGLPVTLRVFCALLLPVLIAAVGHLFAYDDLFINEEISVISGMFFEAGQKQECGGVLGGLLAMGLGNALSVYGALPVLIAAIIFCVVVCFKVNVSGAMEKAASRPHVKYDPSMYVMNTPIPDDPEVISPVVVKNDPAAGRKEGLKIQRLPRQTVAPIDVPLGNDEDELPLRDLRSTAPRKKPSEMPEVEPPKPTRKAPEAPVRDRAERELPVERIKPRTERFVSPGEDEARRAGVDVDELRSTVEELMKPVTYSTEIADPPKKRMSRAELAAETQAVAAEISSAAAEVESDYTYPPITLLQKSVSGAVDSGNELSLNKDRLEGALHSFGIPASIVGMTHGPTVTRYDVELEQGVKLSKVTNLAGDLALALGVVSVRIAPIPDMISTVGIEVPNKHHSTVYLREIIESPKFMNAKPKLSIALGKDIGGESVVGNIAKMPHLLIAGTTGSGKSVCMNSLILSLLYKATPSEVRLVMIDPKMVELSVYNGIPHLYVPVVTDPKKAAGALQWSVVEMQKRYSRFSDMGVRDLATYNKCCVSNGEETMPQVVIVIDELADLMMVASKEVEESICRVAQMGRAAGMHLVIATQRPSADVITGLMKANIPSRIAFSVSSGMESRIILDQTGAEKLVGNGDMLYSPIGCGKPTRVQGAFVTDEEREEVINFIKAGAAQTEKNSEIEDFMNKSFNEKTAAENGGAKSSKESSLIGDYDELLPQAVEAALEMKSCSSSYIQRRVKVGYARAARILDQMEELGIVPPADGAKPRNLLINQDGWLRLQVQLGILPEDALPSTMGAGGYDEEFFSEDSFDEEI